tara:strand:- start:142 stop:792 length:651 start_codon:yes stop_codon:yes gene_type:complete
MESLKINNKQFFIYKNDIPKDLKIGASIAIDTETTGLSLIRDRLCVLQLSDKKDTCHLIKFETDFFRQNQKPTNLINLLSNHEIEKVFHYARFDLSMIKKFFDLNLKNIFCTKIASKLVRTYTDKHGLKDLCKELLEIEISKSQQSSDWSVDELSKKQIKYAASDVFYLNDLKNILVKMLKRENRHELALKTFNFLETRVDLDLMGWHQNDIFSHS